MSHWLIVMAFRQPPHTLPSLSLSLSPHQLLMFRRNSDVAIQFNTIDSLSMWSTQTEEKRRCDASILSQKLHYGWSHIGIIAKDRWNYRLMQVEGAWKECGSRLHRHSSPAEKALKRLRRRSFRERMCEYGCMFNEMFVISGPLSFRYSGTILIVEC